MVGGGDMECFLGTKKCSSRRGYPRPPSSPRFGGGADTLPPSPCVPVKPWGRVPTDRSCWTSHKERGRARGSASWFFKDDPPKKLPALSLIKYHRKIWSPIHFYPFYFHPFYFILFLNFIFIHFYPFYFKFSLRFSPHIILLFLSILFFNLFYFYPFHFHPFPPPVFRSFLSAPQYSPGLCPLVSGLGGFFSYGMAERGGGSRIPPPFFSFP